MKPLRLPQGVDATAPVDAVLLRTTARASGFETIITNPEGHEHPLETVSMTPPHELGPAGVELVVERLLGRGGMGAVLKARQTSMARDVAVKVARTAEGGQRLLQEARLTGAVEHPGVVPVYSVGSTEGGQPVLVMRQVDGVSWRDLLDHPLHPFWAKVEAPGEERLETNVRLLVMLCNTLAFAHARGVLHRDFKPENVLMGAFGETYLADWGIAARLEAAIEPNLVGTPAYLAPEMARADTAQLSPRTDVFLLGATLFELLTGRPPWTGSTLQQSLAQAAVGQVPALPATAPTELAAICRRATATEPQDRYQSALELRDALSGFLGHRGSLTIARATQRRLDALTVAAQTRGTAAEVYPLLSECRFGFTQALAQWPSNPVALDGLERALTVGVEFELAQGHGFAARALFVELRRPAEAMKEAVEAMVAREESTQRRLEAVEATADPRRDARRRTLVVIAISVLMATMFGLSAASDVLAGRWALVLAGLLFSAVLGTSMLGLRLRLKSTTWLNRTVLGAVVVMNLASLTTRSLGALFDVSRHLTLAFELALLAAVCAVLGIGVHRAAFRATALYVAAMGLVLAVPRWSHELYTLAILLAFVFVSRGLRLGRSTILSGLLDSREGSRSSAGKDTGPS